MEERFEGLRDNPEKRVLLFKIAVIASYSMLILGSLLIVAALATEWL